MSDQPPYNGTSNHFPSNTGGSSAPNLQPHSESAEQAVLGSILLNAEALYEVKPFLTPDHFFFLSHRWIYDAMCALYERQESIDPLTIAEELRSRNQLGQIGGEAYLMSLVNNTPTYIHVETYGRLVERGAIRRRLLEAASGIAKAAISEELNLDEVIDQAESSLYKVTADRLTRELVPMSEAVREYFERVERQLSGEQVSYGIPTGFAQLDELLGGLQRSDLIIVAARPGVGKTSFMLSIAANAARTAKAQVAIFSLEMGRDQLVQRFYAAETMISSQRLRTFSFQNNDEYARFVEATTRLEPWPIHIDDSPGLTVSALRTKCRRLHQETGLDLIIVDYLQLMQSGSRNENRVQEISYISRGLKELARELNVPLLSAAQLSRSVEQRQDKRPQLSDLRESGSIEQDSDVVAFLYRDELYNPNTETPNVAEVIVSKHRNGPTGTIRLGFRKEVTQFTDLTVRTHDLRNL